MSGMGRGGRLLQALKEKEKKEEPKHEEPKVRTPSPPTVPDVQAKPPSPPRLMPRSMGRGIISSLLNKPIQPASVAPPPVVPKGSVIIKQTEEIVQPSTSKFQRISPIQDVANLPPRKSPETSKQIEKPVEPSVSKAAQEEEVKPARILPRGRGMLVTKLLMQTAKPGEGTVPRQESKPEQKSELISEPIIEAKPEPKPEQRSAFNVPVIPQIRTRLQALEIVDEIIVKQSDVGSAEEKAKKSTVSTETKYMSIATVSSRATEELKVEHILRKSPVRRMGEVGTKMKFANNYIKLKCKNEAVYQYVVHYDPPVDSQYNRIRLLYGLSDVTGPVRLFDGYTLFLPKCLDDVTTRTVTRKIGDTEMTFTLKIQLTKTLPPENIPPTVFNIIFKNIMKELKMSRIGQHYFSPMHQIDVSSQNLQIWPGYTTAVHDYEDGLYLVLDVAHKVLRSQTCWHLMNDLIRKHAGNPSAFREAVFNSLCGNIVLTKYNNRTYKVDDILWDQNPMSTFSYHNNELITYYDYYKKHYDIEIKDKEQPLLFHRAKPKERNANGKTESSTAPEQRDILCLVPELCHMTGLSDELRNDFNVKKDLAVHTRLSPAQRYEQLEDLIINIKKTPEALKQITNWGLELDDGLNTMDGRVLPQEKIIFARKEVETDAKCDWTRAAGNEECAVSAELKNWLIVYPKNKESIVAKFADTAYECGRKIGVNVAEPTTVPLKDDRPDTYYNEIKRNLRGDVQMVVIVFPMLSDSRYTRVKRLCCIECPVPSQVICVKTISKTDQQLRSVAQKIVLQMNVKLGGEIWRLSIPIKKMMVIGIDVYHKTEKKYKSIAGFVSSLNHDQTRWYSKVCFQMVGQELADTLKTAFLKSIEQYRQVNNFLPDKIFIFRDGVSEGQIPMVAEHEVAQLKSIFTEEYCPQISVIIVQKRISTRVFASTYNKIVNPPPGTIIDNKITSKDHYDFYLVSQHVGQGTVTPTHYIVAYDDTKFKPDYIQRLSYKLTHLYYNWSGTIRVPAPCQYAHKLAFLTGQYLQEEASESLCNRLFYL